MSHQSSNDQSTLAALLPAAGPLVARPTAARAYVALPPGESLLGTAAVEAPRATSAVVNAFTASQCFDVVKTAASPGRYMASAQDYATACLSGSAAGLTAAEAAPTMAQGVLRASDRVLPAFASAKPLDGYITAAQNCAALGVARSAALSALAVREPRVDNSVFRCGLRPALAVAKPLDGHTAATQSCTAMGLAAGAALSVVASAELATARGVFGPCDGLHPTLAAAGPLGAYAVASRSHIALDLMSAAALRSDLVQQPVFDLAYAGSELPLTESELTRGSRSIVVSEWEGIGGSSMVRQDLAVGSPVSVLAKNRLTFPSDQTLRMCRLVTHVNTLAEARHGTTLFKLTTRFCEALTSLPSIDISTQAGFAWFVSLLYQVFHEGPGYGKRLDGHLGETDRETISIVGSLRTWEHHDIGHGAPGNVHAKREQIGRAFLQLIRKPLPSQPSDLCLAQATLVERLIALLERLCCKMGSRERLN